MPGEDSDQAAVSIGADISLRPRQHQIVKKNDIRTEGLLRADEMFCP
jgi:hypothetical protein